MTTEIIPKIVASLVIDWKEVAAVNGTLDQTKVEVIFKSGAKTTVDLESLSVIRPLLELQNLGG